jgi:hypothetical protein
MKITPSKIISVLALFTASAYAAPTGPPPPGAPPPGLPIDAGVWYLAFAAILFGVYKIYQRQLNKETPM